MHDSIPSRIPSSERVKRVFDGVLREEKKNPDFRRHTIKEVREKARIIEKCAKVGLSIDQMEYVLPNFGITLKQRAIYNYIRELKLPRSYKTSSGQQSHHVYMVMWTLVELVKGFNAAGKTVDLILSEAAPEGERFRPDLELHVGNLRFFVEVQLSGIANTRWNVKHRNYLRLYEKIKKPFRTLFVLDQKGEMSYVRQGGRQVLKDRPNLDLFYYATLQTIRDGNFVEEAVWRTAKGEYVPLVVT